ncbi:MAG: aromatic-ring-hydroxylating dioxygenase subunit beta [Gammaproteobacteria bacterium]
MNFVTRIWVGTYADYRTRHFIQRTSCRPAGEGLFDVETNFSVACTPSETGRTQLCATGVYLDRVAVTADGASFLSKKVVTDSALVERFMVYPL